MDHLIYTAMSGANAAAQRQSVLANNLANASTQGFRAELSNFRAVPLRGDGATTRVFALEATSGHDDKPGAIQRTGRDLDMAAQGNSWFAVQGLDGTEAYTRGGAFQVSPEGSLVTSSGLLVLSDGGAPIDVPPGATLTVGRDGTVSAKTGDQPSSTLGRIKLATP
ncbi:MAG: flagellar hook-basal body complex protein, partial [Gammaproteobacteria bacterium]|nr:flagellar hook-basal body complex protein [Gammaproteobacteria bacterium]